MSSDVSPAASQAVISEQMQRVRNDRPAETPRTEDVVPPPPPAPPPPAESGRGQNVDQTA